MDLASLESAIAEQVQLNNILNMNRVHGSCIFSFSVVQLSSCFQGNLVRELKGKEEKSVWQPEVAKLLKLKKQLADLTGTAPVSTNKKSKKKK